MMRSGRDYYYRPGKKMSSSETLSSQSVGSADVLLAGLLEKATPGPTQINLTRLPWHITVNFWKEQNSTSPEQVEKKAEGLL
jgi:hypothetical protein